MKIFDQAFPHNQLIGLLLILLLVFSGLAHSRPDGSFPRIMGMNIGGRDPADPSYLKDMAKLDVVIIGFYQGDDFRRHLIKLRTTTGILKRLNPKILIGQYTILGESPADGIKYKGHRDKIFKLDKQDWWARNENGDKVQWSEDYDAYDVNITDWTLPDFNGQRYPEWIADRDYRVFFSQTKNLDIWYFDNVWPRPGRNADWNLDGKDDLRDDSKIQQAYRKAHLAEWTRARQLAPSVLQMGNIAGDLTATEYFGKLNGGFFEGMMGHTWSIERWGGWDNMMERYHRVFPNLLQPKIVGFNVYGKLTDYRFFRYGFASCLMNDGYFSFTDEVVEYKSVPWFDEYNVSLGKAIDPPQMNPWQEGVYGRRFDNGMVLVNPTNAPVTIDIGSGYRHFYGNQDPVTNNGERASVITVPAKDGLILVLDNG